MSAETTALWQVIISALTLVVLLATLITLIFYTKYTYKMQRAVERQAKIASDQTRELIRQRRLSVLPAFVAYPLEPRQPNRIELHNIGKGVALNVKVKDVRVPHESYPEARIVFPLALTIKIDEKKHPGVDFAGVGEGNEKNKAMNSAPINNFLNDKEYFLEVTFFDVEGHGYEQRLKMSNGRCIPSTVTAASNNGMHPTPYHEVSHES
jgi:FAD synthase